VANGAECAIEDCEFSDNAVYQVQDTIVDGFVWLNDKVTITNAGLGFTKISSENHYTQISGDLTYKGEARSGGQYQSANNPLQDDSTKSTLLVFGATGVDILGATKVTMDSIGQATFMSDQGHVHFRGAVTFEQSSVLTGGEFNPSTNGLSIIAQGEGCPGY